MKRVSLALNRFTLAIAFATAILAWLVFAIVGGYVVNHAERAILDAADAAVRAELSGAPEDRVRAQSAALAQTAVNWNVTIAAFDRTGRLIAGDPSMRGDGLRAGGAATPPTGRLLAVVETRDGYVLLAPSQNYVTYIRVVAVSTFFSALLVGLAVGLIGCATWGVARRSAADRARTGFEAIDGKGAQLGVSSDDPLFGDLTASASAAIDRVRLSSDARAQSEDRLRAFLADAGHELRTPLAIAIGYTGILQRDALEDTTLARRIVGDVALEHARLQRLIERILQLARLDAVAGDPGATCDIVRVAHEAIALVRPLAPERAIVVRAPDAAWIALAPDDARDALRNLLENALRYAPTANVSLSIDRAPGATTIAVADDGPGMSAFAVTHAFDRFFRGSQSGESPGTGLGLAIVRRIAERAGGSARLRSVEASGTTVEIEIPNAAST